MRIMSSSRSRHKRWGEPVPAGDQAYTHKRQVLIRAASRAFGRSGVSETSLEQIAEKLNLTKPALYYYVSSKDELICECYMLALDYGDEAIALAEKSGANGMERIRLFLARYIELLIGEMNAPIVLLDYSSIRRDLRERIQKRRREFDKVLRQMIVDGIADGSIALCDPKLAVFWFMGAVNSIPRWFDAAGPKTGAEIAEAFIAFTIAGLQA